MKHITNDKLEIFPWEAGKEYTVKESFTIEWRGKKLTITKGFKHDRYTVAPDLPDRKPAISHDFAYIYQRWDDGTDITRFEADCMFRDLMRQSEDRTTRSFANLYFVGVRCCGWWGWSRNNLKNVSQSSIKKDLL